MQFDEYKTIFVHIPKNGGTSILRAWGVPPKTHIHTQAKHYKKLFPDKWKEYFTFTIVRNTWDRTLSAYLHQHMRSVWHEIKEPINREILKYTHHNREEVLKYGGYIQFLRHINSKPSLSNKLFAEFEKFLLNIDIPLMLSSGFFRPQILWVMDYSCPNTNNICLDFIGRFEDLQGSFDFVCDKIGIPRQDLPHIGQQPHPPYREIYTDRMRDIIAEAYKAEIEYFNYKF